MSTSNTCLVRVASFFEESRIFIVEERALVRDEGEDLSCIKSIAKMIYRSINTSGYIMFVYALDFALSAVPTYYTAGRYVKSHFGFLHLVLSHFGNLHFVIEIK